MEVKNEAIGSFRDWPFALGNAYRKSWRTVGKRFAWRAFYGSTASPNFKKIKKFVSFVLSLRMYF